MDFGEIWQTIDERVDWLIAGIIFLLVANLCSGGYLFYIYSSQQDFHQQYNIPRTGGYEEEKKQLQNMPSMAEIEIEPPEETKPFPERYAELEGTDLFVSMAERMKEVPQQKPQQAKGDGSDTQQKKVLPPVTGFEIMGRIVGKSDTGISVIRNKEKDKTYVAREGQYLEDTEIKVIAISDTKVQLKKPEHKVTTLRFEVDEMSEEISEYITRY